MRFLARLVLAAATLFWFAALSARAGEPPTDSVYRLDVPLVDQDGNGQHLADRRGKLLVVGMFYTSCHNVCPLIVDTMLATERALATNGSGGVDVLFVSFDAGRDDPIALRRTADSRKLDAHRWTLARTEPADVRKLAAVLGIQYRALPDGEFNHTTAVILVDADGRISARTTRLGDADPAFVKRVKSQLVAARH